MEEILHFIRFYVLSFPLAPLNVYIVHCAGYTPNVTVVLWRKSSATHIATPTLRLRGRRGYGDRTLFRMPDRVVQDFRHPPYLNSPKSMMAFLTGDELSSFQASPGMKPPE